MDCHQQLMIDDKSIMENSTNIINVKVYMLVCLLLLHGKAAERNGGVTHQLVKISLHIFIHEH